MNGTLVALCQLAAAAALILHEACKRLLLCRCPTVCLLVLSAPSYRPIPISSGNGAPEEVLFIPIPRS
jgi:hypothetical protein